MASSSVNFDATRVLAQIDDAASDAVLAACRYLEQEANKTCPFEDGTLEGSSDSDVEATSTGAHGAVSYNTPYARRQHEDPQMTHKGKGRHKWLEKTALEQADEIQRILAKGVGEAFEGTA